MVRLPLAAARSGYLPVCAESLEGQLCAPVPVTLSGGAHAPAQDSDDLRAPGQCSTPYLRHLDAPSGPGA